MHIWLVGFCLFGIMSILLTIHIIFNESVDRKLITLQKIPFDHPYRPILKLDNETNFLDPDVRTFLARSGNLAFPTRYNAVFMETLLEFDRVWRIQLKRTFMLHAGTLLGAIRHAGKIPWDDDLDLMVNLTYNATLNKDLANTRFSFTSAGPFRKLYLKDKATKATNSSEPWPFIDLFFYYQDGTDFVVNDHKKDIVPIKFVFPTSEALYKGHKFAIPRCPQAFLKVAAAPYNSDSCWKFGHSHRIGYWTPWTSISCSKLHGFFQFAEYKHYNRTHVQQRLLKAVPLKEIEAMRRDGEHWTNGAILRMDLC